jgi:hypothetical protein
MKNTNTKILFVKHNNPIGKIENKVIAYFPQEHRVAFKFKGKLIKTKENSEATYENASPAKKSQYRNLLADLIVSGEKNVQVLNRK